MRYLVLFFLSALMTGCVTGASTLDQNTADSLTHIHIVPIEGPPLSGMDLSRAGLAGAEFVVIGTTTGSSGLLIYGGILMMAEIPEANVKSAAASKSVESLLDSEGNWEPTAEVAAETMRQLSSATKYSVRASFDVRPLAGVNRREATVHMENWMAPLRAYYNMDISPYDYSGQPDSGAVLEVGILNYELSSGYFLVQVIMKLVDPASGSVIANARTASNPKVDNLDSLFDDNAAAYKQLFHDTTSPLVKECIAKLGLAKN